MCVHSPLCCLLMALACISTPASATDSTSATHAKRLLAALDASKNAQIILSVVAQTRNFREGKEYSRAKVTALLPLDGSTSRAVMAYTPFVKVNPTINWESNIKTTFNGHYWAMATYDLGNVGDIPTPLKKLKITKEADPYFNTYLHTTALQLCLPFVRFQESHGWFSLRQLLEGYGGYAWTITEEKRGGTLLLKLGLGSNEWLLIDPARNFVVLEHVMQSKNWSQEARARKVSQSSCGLWFVTDYVFTDTINGKEQKRFETQIIDATFADQAALEKELEPSHGSGWQVIDERTQKEYLIQDDAKEVFEKLDVEPQ